MNYILRTSLGLSCNFIFPKNIPEYLVKGCLVEDIVVELVVGLFDIVVVVVVDVLPEVVEMVVDGGVVVEGVVVVWVVVRIVVVGAIKTINQKKTRFTVELIDFIRTRIS